MIEIEIGLAGGAGRRGISSAILAGHVAATASQLRQQYPDFELWEVVSERQALYTIRSPRGEQVGGVVCITPRAPRFGPGDIVLVGFHQRRRDMPYILSRQGRTNWGNETPPTIVPIVGYWDQAWGNFHRLGVGFSGAQWWQSFSDVYSYSTDQANKETGPYGRPEGIVATDQGAILVTKLGTKDNSGQWSVWGLRVHLIQEWNQASVLDIPFRLERDFLQNNSYHPDSSVFWDKATQTLTLFSNMQPNPPGFISDRVVSVWTVRIVEAGGGKSLELAGFSEVTVRGDDDVRQTMRNPNVAESWMTRNANRGYRLVKGIWKDAWSGATWAEQVRNNVGLREDPSFSLAAPVASNNLRSNAGPPGYTVDGQTRWLMHCVTGTRDLSMPTSFTSTVAPGWWTNVRVVSASVAAENGSLAEFHSFWEQPGYFRYEAMTLSVCAEWADWQYSQTPGLHEYDNPETISSSAWIPGPGPGYGDTSSVLTPYSYTLWRRQRWHGFSQESVELFYGRDFSILRHLPTRGFSFTPPYENLPALKDDMPIGVPLPILLPDLNGANMKRGWDAITLRDAALGGPAHRSVRCPDVGTEFAAMWVAIPIYVPGDIVGNNMPGNAGLDSQTLVAPPHYSTPTSFDSGYRLTDITISQIAVPRLAWAWELKFCNNRGTIPLAPLQRHTGLTVVASSNTSSVTLNVEEALPIPEQCWQILPIAYIGIVVWLYDHRPEGWLGSPQPMLRVTDYNLETIHTITLAQLLADIPPPWEDDPHPSEILETFGSDMEWGPLGTEYRWLYGRNDGPSLRLQKRPLPEIGPGWYEHLWWLGVEATERVEPVEGSTGRVWGITWCLKLETDHYEILSCEYSYWNFTYPFIPIVDSQGPHLVERLAFTESARVSALNGKIRATT